MVLHIFHKATDGWRPAEAPPTLLAPRLSPPGSWGLAPLPFFFSIPACGLGTALSHRLGIGVSLPLWLSLSPAPTANRPRPRWTWRTPLPNQASLLGRRNQIKSSSLNTAKVSILRAFLPVIRFYLLAWISKAELKEKSESVSCLIVSNSLQLHGLQLDRFLCP